MKHHKSSEFVLLEPVHGEIHVAFRQLVLFRYTERARRSVAACCARP